MANEPLWLSSDDLRDLNRYTVTKAGEPFGVLNDGALEGALARPKNRFYYEGEDDVLVLACVVLIGIGRAHAFMQGNKRTALLAANLFLMRNGYELSPVSADGVEIDDLLGPITEDFIVRDRPAELLADLLGPFVKDLS